MTAQQTAPSVIVTNNRDATPEDAKVLGTVYRSLVDGAKEAKKADRAVTEGWLDIESLPGLRSHRDATRSKLDSIMDAAWKLLKAMPNGVVSRGATPQTVGLQFFNRNLNRNLLSRITASQAKSQNKAAFGV